MRRPNAIWTALLVSYAVLGIAVFGRADTITLKSFAEHMIETHPLFREQALAVDVQSEARRGLLGAEDWQLLGAARYAHQEPSIALFGPDRTDAFMVEGSLGRRFWSTGGRLSTSYSFTRNFLDIDPAFGFPDSYYEHHLGISYVHPLMRNRGGRLDRLSYDLKQYEIDRAELEARETGEAFLARTLSRFLDWVFLTVQRDITEERRRLSQEELERTQSKRKANLVDEADVIRAADAVRIWTQSVLLVESEWKAVQAELAITSQDETLWEATPEFDLYQTEPVAPLEQIQGDIESESRVLALIKSATAQLRHQRTGLEEVERPDLNLALGASLKRAEPGFAKAFGLDRPDAQVGLEFGVPLGNRSAKSDVARTDLLLARLEQELARARLELFGAYAGLAAQAAELERVLELNREQIRSAGLRTAEEARLYSQGRGELTFVIQSRDNEQNARLTYARNALTYQKLLLEARALRDRVYP